MTGVVTLTGELVHQIRHPRQRPQIRGVTRRQRSGFQSGDKLLGLVGVEPRLAPRPAFALERGLAPIVPCGSPPAHRLATGFETSRHFRVAQSVVEMFRRPMPALFHRFVIACLCHRQILPDHSTNVTLLYES
jgi:hypothetical protein